MRLSSLITTLGLAALLCGCCPKSEREAANKQLVREFAAAINSADWDALDDLLSEDFTRHCQATPDVQVHSRKAFKKVQEAFLAGVPDQKIDLKMIVAEEDKVAAYAVYSGTQTGAMGNIPPTGKHFESNFLSVFRIEGNRIAELWVEWDNVAILAQLGVFPPPQGGAD